ncbi:tyrosine-type recombinase/integrase [Streptomyces sp. NPDC017546]|uniref:tyrosine-type recombinase/integrase n=1 Tax=Streptomyces sp. NPDC017546 TaxID=3365001 RepID=UPI0037899167
MVSGITVGLPPPSTAHSAHPNRRPHPPARQDPRTRAPPLPPTECLHALEEHRVRQDGEREAAGSARQDSGLVFTTPTGPPAPANLTRRIRFPDLRHSTATLLLEHDVDLVVIKELLDHAHIGVTGRRLRPRPTPPPTPGHRHPRQCSRPGRRPRCPAQRSRRPLTLPSALPSNTCGSPL